MLARMERNRYDGAASIALSFQLLAAFANENWLVRLAMRVRVALVSGVRLGVDTPHLLGRGHQRSISPMTMSMLALIAMTSDKRCPSTIFGIAARLTNDGGRMRQRTGFDVPSDTM